MKKGYYLSSCSTCKRILSEIENDDFDLQDIKNDEITEEQIGQMAELSGSYESLFSRRAQKYKEMGLKDKKLEEQDYKKLILEHYTFLKRPVFVVGEKIYVGNSKKVVAELVSDL
jgi:arsenate reductase (glutaredoxin)